ncbi:DUF4307 domain-containing protein [Saccharothrix coeruleofusca]|uniref:DUF4307 domain-containing protein n=1 Tax=Saccharothrix coeruleofusca TaxID=33919 RepID=A0A918APK7_9PSEU|nr:DUF4307 domain-containing protein [Saccharothrix coeruleofusca]GGP60130.1 hypothetical protein GCM10010185_35690 [Saccharothrix coeruleofusca]
MAGRALPEGRYGKTSRPMPKWARWSLPVIAVLLGAVVAWVGYRNLGAKPVEAKQTAFQVLDAGSVEITLEVVRDTPDRAVVCVVRARSDDGDEAGRREVLVPPGPGTTFARTVLKTSKPPVTGEVFGCSYQVPAYLSTR